MPVNAAKRIWYLIGLSLFATLISSPMGIARTDRLTLKQHLGKFLYFDENLSEPPGQSCASCHLPEAGFADPDRELPVSRGIHPDRFGDRPVGGPATDEGACLDRGNPSRPRTSQLRAELDGRTNSSPRSSLSFAFCSAVGSAMSSLTLCSRKRSSRSRAICAASFDFAALSSAFSSWNLSVLFCRVDFCSSVN